MTSTVQTNVSLVTCILTLGLAGCSVDQHKPQVSNVSSIASPSGSTNILYWQDQSDLFRGTCITGKPIVIANCSTNMLKISVTDITKRSMASGQRGVDAIAQSITAELTNLRGNDPTVVSLNQQIAALTKQKPALETAVAAAAKQVQADDTTKTQLDERLAYDLQQLNAVAAALTKTPTDQILLDLQRDLRIDQLQVEAKSIEVAERIVVTKRRLTSQQAILSKIDADLAAKQNELKLYQDGLDVFSPRLDQLRIQKIEADAAMTAVPKVMTFIADGNVVYRGNILPKDLAGALVIIDRSFTTASLEASDGFGE